MTTLEKWCKRLGIEPARHPQDWRFRVLSDEQVERIRQERAQMPGSIADFRDNRPSSSTLAFDRSKSDEGTASEASPTVAPVPRQRPLRAEASTPLPAGMMSRSDAAARHHVPLTTLRRWCDEGRIETAAETYGGAHGTFAVARPVTQKGLAQFYELASPRRDFVRCDACPHAHAED